MKTLTQLEEINQAVEDVRTATLANIKAMQDEISAKSFKEKTHYAMVQANARLRSLQYNN